ncbi:hypothetical protein JAAARDRAFT_242513 [Jaapia argillacea MUCL 33604]|uniref:Uncharacterized protein n=1 Tax=Jaapia argillacea MUCL 33604 TaxID=933084 RepID=A0A067QD08_9AGAM|nr:hypothetical protein JAAARDRAFT_242513 [Jaapia argillacea MUCL 33604]
MPSVPESVMYTSSRGGDGGVVYQLYKAVTASYQTSRGFVNGTTWISAGSTGTLPVDAKPAPPDFAASWHRNPTDVGTTRDQQQNGEKSSPEDRSQGENRDALRADRRPKEKDSTVDPRPSDRWNSPYRPYIPSSVSSTVPSHTPFIPPPSTPYIPPSSTPYIPPSSTPYILPSSTPYILPSSTPYIPPSSTPYIPPYSTPYIPSPTPSYMPPPTTPFIPPTAIYLVPNPSTPSTPSTPFSPPTVSGRGAYNSMPPSEPYPRWATMVPSPPPVGGSYGAAGIPSSLPSRHIHGGPGGPIPDGGIYGYARRVPNPLPGGGIYAGARWSSDPVAGGGGFQRGAASTPGPFLASSVQQEQIVPGSTTYTTTVGADGRVVYHRFRAIAARYETPQGIVEGVQLVPFPVQIPPPDAIPATSTLGAPWNGVSTDRDTTSHRQREEKGHRREKKASSRRSHQWERDRPDQHGTPSGPVLNSDRGQPDYPRGQFPPTPRDESRIHASTLPAFNRPSQQPVGSLIEPECFKRPPNATHPYPPFDITRVLELDDLLDEVMPNFPFKLSTHDVYNEDWTRLMLDLWMVWSRELQKPEVSGTQVPRRSSVVADIIDSWNAKFFAPRGLQVLLYKGRECRSGPNSGTLNSHLPGLDVNGADLSASESDSSDSDSENEGNEYREQGGVSERRVDARRADMENEIIRDNKGKERHVWKMNEGKRPAHQPSDSDSDEDSYPYPMRGGIFGQPINPPVTQHMHMNPTAPQHVPQSMNPSLTQHMPPMVFPPSGGSAKSGVTVLNLQYPNESPFYNPYYFPPP